MPKKFLILFIDTSGFERARVMLLGRDLKVSVDFNVRQNWSEQIFPCLARLLAKAGAKLSDISRICVVPGPGSFSGTRTGVAVANALGLALGISVQAVGGEAGIGVSRGRSGIKSKVRTYATPVYSTPPHITKPKT
ncbi:MAG: tRNA (adenosine(37)-N6)-threonylcarbamoyltransferase complex dimerization subunit type 1 TsaB [Patescibacteria group bacterium]|nr:tRNA (adenosine(37)-N6)-threonylcarbamoyltransferase complex dimerization subunit type 1 TsaB [Patescibacteria group bacterium]